MRESLTMPLPTSPDSSSENTEEELVHAIEKTVGNWLDEHKHEPFSPEKLTALVEFLGEEQREALETLGANFGDKELHPRRPSIKLFGEEGKDVPSLSLNGWRSGEQSTIHDHMETEGAYHLFQGELDEEHFMIPPNTELETIKNHAGGVPVKVASRPFTPGETISLPTPYIHRVTNNSESTALTIHAYYPQLKNLRYYDVTEENLVFVEDAKTKRARIANNQ